jgi:hypothetical protein
MSIPAGTGVVAVYNAVYPIIYPGQQAATGTIPAMVFGFFKNAPNNANWPKVLTTLASSPLKIWAVLLAEHADALLAAEQKQKMKDQAEPAHGSILAEDQGRKMALPAWETVCRKAAEWVMTQVKRGNIGSRYFDILVAHMGVYLQGQRLPVWNDPSTPSTKETQDLWFVFKKDTGANEAFKAYYAAQSKQFAEDDAAYRRMDAILGGTAKVLGYISMTEPIKILGEKLATFFSSRDLAKKDLQAYYTAVKVKPDLFTPAEKAEIEQQAKDLLAQEQKVYNLTNPIGGWSGAPPAALGAINLIATGIIAGAAVVAVGAVTIAIHVVNEGMTRRASLRVQERIQEAAKADKAVALANFNEAKARILGLVTKGEISGAQAEDQITFLQGQYAAQVKDISEAAIKASEVASETATKGGFSLFSGVGLLGVLGIGGFLIYSSMKKGRSGSSAAASG